jgi:hypothetical protein
MLSAHVAWPVGEKEELVRGHGHHCLAGHLPNYDYDVDQLDH